MLSGEGMQRDQILLRAHSLTYLTLLSLLPLLALAVSLVDLLGVSADLTRLIAGQIAAGSPEAARFIEERAENLEFGALGTLGGAVLLGTTILAVGSVEKALNGIWGVTKQRPWVRRVPDYLAVVLVAPLLLGIAISLATTLQSQWVVQRLLETPYFEDLLRVGLRQAPTVLLVGAFSLLYWFLPNTSVRIPSALLGGLVAGILFMLAQRVYVGFNMGAARYDAVFGTFAALPLLMVWIYISWTIVLLGAEIAYAHQTLPTVRREARGGPLSLGAAARESIGIAVALESARAFRDARPVWTPIGLADDLDLPLRTVQEVAEKLEAAGLLIASGEREGGYQLGRPAEQVRVADVLVAIRGERASRALPESAVGRRVQEVVREIDANEAKASEAHTLRDLLEGVEPSVDPPRAAE